MGTDEDFVGILRIDSSVVDKTESNFLVKLIGEEIKKLSLVDFIICWLNIGHTSNKQIF